MTHRKRFLSGAVLLVVLGMPWANARALTLVDTNVVDLLRDSESIVVGQVAALSDGIDERGLPYTEVTIEINESIRGSLNGTYTFRQFGLREPRLSADGTRRMLAAPEGFPKFTGGEPVALFLNRPAGITGLQTTIGLANGKFTLGAARAENDRGNVGLFRNVGLATGLATENDMRMLATEVGAVSSDTFLSFVRRAVRNSWVESCQLWDTSVGKTCPSGGPGTSGGTTSFESKLQGNVVPTQTTAQESGSN